MPGFEGTKTFSRFEDVIVCTGCLVGSRSLGRDRQCRDRCEVIKAAEPSTPRASREARAQRPGRRQKVRVFAISCEEDFRSPTEDTVAGKARGVM